MVCTQIKTSEDFNSQSNNKKVSETKSLKRLKSFISQSEVIGVDTQKAGIKFTPDVLEFCKEKDYHLIGRAIYFKPCEAI